jgi:hypothetical protein
VVVDVAKLHRENAELRALVENHATVTAQLNGVIEKLTMQLAQMNERVTELLAVARRQHRKPASKPDAAVTPPPALLDDAKRSFDERPKPPMK